MNWRCYRNTIRKKYYKDKGISVERNTFQDFINDMYESYLEHCKLHWEKNTTIDRIDNDWNYCKENCRWATYKKQSINTSNNHYLTKGNIKKTTKERAEELWINENTMRVRIMRWHDPFVLWKIPDKRGSVLEYWEDHKKIHWEKAKPYHCIYSRIKISWWDIERAITTP